MKRSMMKACSDKALMMFEEVHIFLTDEEKSRLEVADFGLGIPEQVGLQLITYVNTERVCAKEMVLFPGQTCPEHRHVGRGEQPGKEETFRCRYGRVYLYVDGPGEASDIHGTLPPSVVTVFHEIILNPGQQHTLLPGTRHWFQGGAEGAVVSEFSTHNTDETDIFTDTRITRFPTIED